MSNSLSPLTHRVAGKVAVVTGAASGIGRATALLLAREGAAVYCADLNLAGAEDVAAAIIAEGGAAWPWELDVSAEDAWQQGLKRVAQERGQLNILVNCAGISHASPLVELSVDDWRRVMEVNLEGAFLGTKHAIAVMRKLAGRGSIVNVSSVSGVKAQLGASAYCTSKAAVIMLSKCAAVECLKNGDSIRVNAISPSGVKTPMWKTMPFFQELMAQEGGEEQAFLAMERASPEGRFALPEEIAFAILYLASDESLYVNGTNLVIDNGDTA